MVAKAAHHHAGNGGGAAAAAANESGAGGHGQTAGEKMGRKIVLPKFLCSPADPEIFAFYEQHNTCNSPLKPKGVMLIMYERTAEVGLDHT